MKDKIARSDAQVAIALAKKAGSGGGLPTPSASDIGKLITVESDGEGGAEYGLVSFPDPMVYKGTLGVGGDATSLPTASSSNNGWVYKVITDGTYAGQEAEAGDTFISNGSTWGLVPSGDDAIEISNTLTAGQTQLTFTNSAIKINSLVDVYSDVWYIGNVQSEGSVVLTFPAQSVDMVVKIKVSR